MKKILLITLLTVCFFSLNAQPCLSVQDNGSVLFTNLTDYLSLTIHDQDGTLIKTVDKAEFQDGNYTYTGTEALSNNLYASFEDAEGNIIDNLSSVYLTATADDDKIALVWNPKHYSSVHYNIYRKLTAEENYSLIYTFEEPDDYLPAASDDFTYEDKRVSNCEIAYKIERVENGCSSWSNVITVSAVDNEEPASVNFTGIDVDEQTQKLNIHWSVCASQDTWGYVVCKKNSEGIRVTLDTLLGRNNTSYTCNDCPSLSLNDISVYAFDSCNNPSDNSPFYSNIVLRSSRTSCNDPLTLTWYQNYPTLENRTFDVFAKINDGNYEKVAAEVNNTSFQYDMPSVEGQVSFYVKTTSSEQSKMSFTSNIVTVPANGIDTLGYIYLNTVSVGTDNSSITIKAQYDATKKVSHLELWRRMDKEEYVKVKDLEYTSVGYITTEDFVEPNVTEHQYTYKILAPDVCGSGLYSSSNELTTIQLKIDATAQPKIRLVWNPYTPLAWTVKAYEVYRFAEGNIDNAELIGSTSAVSFIDNTDNMVSATDRTYYYIKAVQEDQSVLAGDENWSANSSNGYAKFESIFFIPNAFSPKEGVNERIATFKPECHFVRSGTYSFKVYNRKGEMLFETNDPDEGWNGKYKDVYCPVGTYVYKIKFVNSEGMEENKGGVFMLFE